MTNTLEAPETLAEPTGDEVKKSWFDAYRRSNRLWPSAALPGIGIITLRAVLEDPPHSGAAFMDSDFSKNQVEILGKYLSYAHIPYDVQYKTSEFATAEDETVSDTRVSELWTNAKSVSGFIILSELYGRPYEECMRTPESAPEGWSYWETEQGIHDLELIIDFFDNPDMQERRDTIASQLAGAEAILYSDDGKEIAELYRLGISKAAQRGTDEQKVRFVDLYEKYEPEYEALGINEPFDVSTLSEYDDKLNGCFPIILNRLQSGLRESRPNEAVPFLN